jgi:hypothetical protein
MFLNVRTAVYTWSRVLGLNKTYIPKEWLADVTHIRNVCNSHEEQTAVR